MCTCQSAQNTHIDVLKLATSCTATPKQSGHNFFVVGEVPHGCHFLTGRSEGGGGRQVKGGVTLCIACASLVHAVMLWLPSTSQQKGGVGFHGRIRPSHVM